MGGRCLRGRCDGDVYLLRRGEEGRGLGGVRCQMGRGRVVVCLGIYY